MEFRALTAREVTAICPDLAPHRADLETWFAGRLPDAADVRFVGGLFQGLSVSAVGATLDQAMRRAVGEAAEVMALRAITPGEPAGLDPGMFAHCLPDSPADTGIVPAFSLGPEDIPAVPIPATELGSTWHPPASEGCGAGPGFDVAWHHGVLELVERDALALWWYGGCRARRLGWLERDLLSSEDDLTLLLDITATDRVPAVVACGFDEQGRMFTHGSAAALTLGEAATKALGELRQMRAGHHIIRLKMQKLGPQALSPKDHNAIRLASEVARKDVCAEAIGDTVSAAPRQDTEPADLPEQLRTARLRVAVLDLGTHLGLRVAKAVSPDLQPSVPLAETPRLRAARQNGSGSFACFRGLPLV